VVYPGEQSYSLNPKTMVVPLARLRDELRLTKLGTA
jgi:hypothetical protein